MNIDTLQQLDAVLDAGPYAGSGLSPFYFVMDDGRPLSFAAAEENAEYLRASLADGAEDGWRPVALEINWDNDELVCSHTTEPIECAYAEDDDYAEEPATAAGE